MNPFYLFLTCVALTFVIVGITWLLSLCKAAANDYGPAAERDSKEGLEGIQQDFEAHLCAEDVCFHGTPIAEFCPKCHVMLSDVHAEEEARQ